MTTGITHHVYTAGCYAPPAGPGVDPVYRGLDINPATLLPAGQVTLGRVDPYDAFAVLTFDLRATAGVLASVLLNHPALIEFWQDTTYLLRADGAIDAEITVRDLDDDKDVALYVGRGGKGEPVFLRADLRHTDDHIDLIVWLDPHGLVQLNQGADHIARGM